MKAILAFLAGAYLGYLLRPRQPWLPVADSGYEAGDAWYDGTKPERLSMEPTYTYNAAKAGYMSISWMQSDGTFTWSGLGS